jgi:hypothetical protein
MKEKIKDIFVQMRDHRLLLTFIVSFMASMLAIVVAAIMEGVTAKMICEYLINFNLLYIPVVFFVSLTIYSGYRLVRQVRKQYVDLFELTKLPSDDKIITIEPAGYPEVATRENSVIPYLHFKFNVHNHSYYLFRPKEVVLTCSNNGKEVVKEVWDINKDKEYISAEKRIIIAEALPTYQARSIMFKVPIEDRYPDWSTWDFEGYATYTNGGEERNVKIETRHHLSDKNIHKLEEKLKVVLGDVK